MTGPIAESKTARENPRVTELDRQWRAWMAAAQAGDRSAYEALLSACIPFVKAVARQQGVAADRVDDVVQETLITVHRARQTYDPRRSFIAWLRTLAQRRAIDGLRRHGRRAALEVYAADAYENHPEPAANPAETADQSARAAALSRAIATLPAGQREAVERIAIGEQSLAEAAAATGRSTVALKVNLHRAIKTLRVRLGKVD